MWLYGLLLGLALLERLVWDMGANWELVTMASVVGGIYLPKKWAISLPLMIMGLSDGFLGVGQITLFTWTGFLLMPLIPGILKNYGQSKWFLGLGSAGLGVLWFYGWTNLGVWLTDSWGMYERNLFGLIACYINALPFLGRQIVSAGITTMIAITSLEGVRKVSGGVRDRRLVINWK